MLHADILVLHLLGLGLGGGQGLIQLGGDIDLLGVTAGAGDAGEGLHLLHRRPGERLGVGAHAGQQLGDQAVLLAGQGREQMLLLDGLVGIFHRQALGRLQRLDGFFG